MGAPSPTRRHSQGPPSDLRPTVLGLSLLGALAVSVGILEAAGSSAPASTMRLAKTEVVRVRPVDGQGHLSPGYTVTETVEGANCPLPSVKVDGQTSSCEAGSAIYDPCWVEAGDPTRPSVLCMPNPWDHEVQRLLTTGDIVTDAPAPDWPPWAFQLADGQQCRVSTGAHGSVESSDDDADVVDYICGEQETRWVGLLRGINHNHRVWTARAARYDNGRWQRIKPQPIARAWF